MKKKISLFPLIILAFLVLSAEASPPKKELPATYKKWLEEEVVYIITPLEKEVFLKLQTDRERDIFIEAFWKHRDPMPETPENEFKTEHYRRINYANHYLGRETAKPGWKTDRGRIYIILGEPSSVEKFEAKSGIHPSEIWFYQGKEAFGLPPGFNLVFLQQGGAGEYKLYSPLKDGPKAFMPAYYGDPEDYLSAYEELNDIEPELARVSLTLIPGEPMLLGRPSLASDLLIQKVESAAVDQVEQKYAQKFLQYKDIVEVEYSANYIDSDSLVKVFRDSSGIYFVHFALELERVSTASYENKFYTSLKINGTVSNPEGKVIYQLERTISLDLDKEKMESASRQPMNIHDMFPLIPGHYKFSVLVKNEISKEFTSQEKDLIIPGDEGITQMTPLLLGYKKAEVQERQITPKPFQTGPFQIYAQPNRVFLRQDKLIVAFQLSDLDEKLKNQGEIKFIFFKNDLEFRSFSKKISEYAAAPNFIEEISFADFLPAHYKIQVALMSEGQEILSQKDEFDITHLEAMARPWVYSKILPAIDDPVYDYLLGTQFFNSGQTNEAKIRLERALEKKPDSPDFALSLAQVYMTLGEYKKIETILMPFLNQPRPSRYELYFLLGKACQRIGELNRAVEIFDKAISHFGININLLNSIGECYFQMGKIKEALVVWEKSLEINPNQPQIRKNVATLKEKK